VKIVTRKGKRQPARMTSEKEGGERKETSPTPAICPEEDTSSCGKHRAFNGGGGKGRNRSKKKMGQEGGGKLRSPVVSMWGDVSQSAKGEITTPQSASLRMYVQKEKRRKNFHVTPGGRVTIPFIQLT